MMDSIFQALAHEIRRQILDIVKENPGCHSGDICEYFDVSRIAISKHIKILEQASLLVIEKSGRHRLHYFNPMPIQAIYERWTDEYSQFFAPKINLFKQQLEREEQQESNDEKTA
ncbi:helix-turn-helix transcriptional regulator [Pleionea sp. CnH1-48]|uniref:ArsR/SmtB family transcription factor n=1 Tax=Pleionea sp. CnH1-48 TaxID=2954494 RepID=UPI002097F07B|nr:winged helix-turn-helix domain-containing protein [Pleionea sp. CnH1-48]MCO7222944.1 winged helix-turn-helix domain-containing protein [Pleionea sp. CnH1-48]